MECLVCKTRVPEGSGQCPKCGDHVGQWQEKNAYAEAFLRQGAVLAQQGEKLRATLALFKAMVLRPTDVRILKALGQILAQQGLYQEASYYLEKALMAPGPMDEEAKTAFEKVQALAAKSAQAPPPTQQETVAAPPSVPPSPEPVPPPQPAAASDSPVSESGAEQQKAAPAGEAPPPKTKEAISTVPPEPAPTKGRGEKKVESQTASPGWFKRMIGRRQSPKRSESSDSDRSD